MRSSSSIILIEVQLFIDLSSGNKQNLYFNMYYCARKVRATDIILEHRRTMMAFIQCTDLHKLPPIKQTFYAFTKEFSNNLIQILLNSIDCFIIVTKIPSHEGVSSSLTIDKYQTAPCLENRHDH